MSTSRLEKFVYAICSMEVSDLPAPLSRIEILWNCLITGESPDFEPQSRNEKYLMAMLGLYELENLPSPMSRGEKLLYKIAMGETDLSDVPGYLSRYEELLKYLIENGVLSDFEYVLYTLNQSLSTLYATVEKPVKSAILKGSTKYRDIDTGEVLDAFEDGRNLELVSVTMPVLTTSIGQLNLILNLEVGGLSSVNGSLVNDSTRIRSNLFELNDSLFICSEIKKNIITYFYDSSESYLSNITIASKQSSVQVSIPNEAKYGRIVVVGESNPAFKVVATNKQTTFNDFINTPFKSNILSTSEDVELRGIGDVQDTLDCLIGEVTERIGEIVLDGSEDERYSINGKADNGLTRFLVNSISNRKQKGYIMNDSLPITYDSTTYGVFSGLGLNIIIYNCPTIDDFKIWLQKNPITIQYELETPINKTIDLTTVDQDGQPTKLKTFNGISYVEMNADPIIPSVDVEVATKISETLATLDPQQNDISETQNQLGQTIEDQTENTDATMMATTEIYEQTL